MTLKDLVASSNIVRFTRYFDGQLWYQTYQPAPPEEGSDDPWSNVGPEFPVPISDIGNATFLPEDRAMLFMRYIRKHLQMLETAKTEVVVETRDPVIATYNAIARSFGMDPTTDGIEVVHFPKKSES